MGPGSASIGPCTQVWLLVPSILAQVPGRHVANILGQSQSPCSSFPWFLPSSTFVPTLLPASQTFSPQPRPPAPSCMCVRGGGGGGSTRGNLSVHKGGTSQPDQSSPPGSGKGHSPLLLWDPGSGPLLQVGTAKTWVFGFRSAIPGSVTCTGRPRSP